MHLSGLVLDFYDDPRAIAACWSSIGDVPGHVKEAHRLSPEEYGRLPDDLFALVLIDQGRQLRKYACIDGGNTEINCHLFLKNAHKLPEEARKVAAQNLITACGWYGLEPSAELQKEALGLGTAANLALVGPSVVKGTHQSIKQNMAGVHALEGGGAVVPPALMKQADLTGTDDMPTQAPAGLKMTVDQKKGQAFNQTAQKTAGTGHLVPGHRSEAGETLEQNKPLQEKQYQVAPQPKVMRPHVDTTGKQPFGSMQEKRANAYAVGDRYPLDTYQEVKLAGQFFDENLNFMAPATRREYASALVKAAAPLGIPVSERARQYGSCTYAPAGEIKQAFDVRRMYVGDGPAGELLAGLWSSRPKVQPDVFCETLGQIDKIAMIDWMYDRFIPDPYASTYGIEKKAEDDMWLAGNDTATKSQIEDFGLTGISSIEASYGAEFANEFRKDPWGIFQSLPLLQKRRLARMATDNSPTGKQHVNI